MTSRTQVINQSIKIYITPLQDPYLEGLPTQAKRKRTVLRKRGKLDCYTYFFQLAGKTDGAQGRQMTPLPRKKSLCKGIEQVVHTQLLTTSVQLFYSCAI